MDARANNARKVTGILALMFGVVPMTFFYYSVERNIRTNKTLARSCQVIRDARSQSLSSATLSAMYGQVDGAKLDGALQSSLSAYCDALPAELSWWTWNVRRPVQLQAPEAVREQVGDLPEQIEQRCQALSPAPSPAQCREKTAILRGFLPIVSVPQPAWDWAARVSAVGREIRAAQGGSVGTLSPY